MKAGQAAVEFLMTYGWAILSVIITIAALSYFGIINQTMFASDACILFPGVACIDFTITNAEAILRIQNNLGENINRIDVTVPSCGTDILSLGIPDGQKKNVAIQCLSSLQTNSRINEKINITYKTSITHARDGRISTIVANNYIKNNQFEAKPNAPLTTIWQWTCVPSTNFNRYSSDFVSADYSIKHAPTVLNQLCTTNSFIPIDPNKDYTLCAHYKALSTPVDRTLIQLLSYDSSAILLETFNAVDTTATTTWIRGCGTKTSFPIGTTQVKVRLIPSTYETA